jgi:hypothetical protein
MIEGVEHVYLVTVCEPDSYLSCRYFVPFEIVSTAVAVGLRRSKILIMGITCKKVIKA